MTSDFFFRKSRIYSEVVKDRKGGQPREGGGNPQGRRGPRINQELRQGKARSSAGPGIQWVRAGGQQLERRGRAKREKRNGSGGESAVVDRDSGVGEGLQGAGEGGEGREGGRQGGHVKGRRLHVR